MPVHIIRADLSNLPFSVDFIVNTANPEPTVGKGLDKSIYEKAGEQMRSERKKIGRICPGDIAITDAYGLNARKVIHAVSVAWTDGFHDEPACIQKCYQKSLAAAADYMTNHGMNSISIAFPLIGTGIYQIPIEVSVLAAISESIKFSLRYNMEIYLVLFDHNSVNAMHKIFPVEEFVTNKESHDILDQEYTRYQRYESPKDIHASIKQTQDYRHNMQPKNFSDMLNYYLDQKEMTAPDIYTWIAISRQSFSEIMSGKKTPKKDTVIQIAIRLQLTLPQLEEFLSKAGHSLSDANEEDRLVKELFASQCYDLYKYNELRVSLGLPALNL